jgi:hypothetical protein
MKHGRSCLIDERQVMASGSERWPTIITPKLAPLSYPRKQASLRANDNYAQNRRAGWSRRRNPPSPDTINRAFQTP